MCIELINYSCLLGRKNMFHSLITTAYINSSTTSDYLIFKIAIHYAEDGSNIWFIAPKPIQTFPQNLPIPNKEILKSITFFYLKTVEDLVKKLNSIQVWERPPDVIIISGYDHYIMNHDTDNDPSDVMLAAYVTASVHDAALACSRKENSRTMEQGKRIHVFVTCNSEHELILPKHTTFKSLINLFFKIVLDTRNKTCEDCFKELLSLLN